MLLKYVNLHHNIFEKIDSKINILQMSTKFTIEMMSAEQITEYIKSQKDSEYSYYICGASLHETQQPETGTEFDEIDFSSLNYPTSNEEDLFFPQLIIGYTPVFTF
jgi:hypothetical protein